MPKIHKNDFLVNIFKNSDIPKQISWDNLCINEERANYYNVPINTRGESLFGVDIFKNAINKGNGITVNVASCLLYTFDMALHDQYIGKSGNTVAAGIIGAGNAMSNLPFDFLKFEEDDTDELRSEKIRWLIRIINNLCEKFRASNECDSTEITQILNDTQKMAKSSIIKVIGNTECHTLTLLNIGKLDVESHDYRLSDSLFKIDAELPYVKNYAGNRLQEIEEIDKHFENNSLLFLYGLGGIGKSILSMLYAKHKITAGCPVYFIRFQSSFMSTIATLATSNFKPYDEYGKMKDLKSMFDEKIGLMQQYCSPNSIFIIDNAYENEKTFDDIIWSEDSGYAFEKILSLPGKKIITTRYEVVDFPNKEVGPLPLDELLKIIDSFYPHNIAENRDIHIELINTVYGHTLTVELLARTLNALRGTKTPQDVLEILRENISVGESLPKIHSDINNKKESIFRHLCKLFSIIGLPKRELILLSQAAMIGDSGLLSSLFFKCCYYQNASIDDCNNLIEKGWIYFDSQDETLFMHPLIRSVLNKEIQNANEYKTEFLDKLLNIENSSLDGSVQIAEIFLKAFQDGFSLDMNAVDLLLETSNKLTEKYACLSAEDPATLEEQIYYVQKCMSIDNVAISILQQVATNHGLSIDWIDEEKQQLMDAYKDNIKLSSELYQTKENRKIAENKLKQKEEELEQLKAENARKKMELARRKEKNEALQCELNNITNENRKLNYELFRRISDVFKSLNHPYFNECLNILKEKLYETDKIDLTFMFEYANQGVKKDILQSYLLLSLCYRWGAGTKKDLQMADKYQRLYIEKRNCKKT